jgi:hypothetical protein
MMEAKDHVQGENISLLKEIMNLRTNLSELYSQTGPSSPDYISLSIKLDLLINKYFDEKISSLTNFSKDYLMEVLN